MKAFIIKPTKDFMGALLGGTFFDNFLLEEATIKTFNTFQINGRIIPEFYDDYEFGYEFSFWKDIRPTAFSLIKGKNLPVSCHFVLRLNPDEMNSLIEANNIAEYKEQISGFVLNIKFQNSEIQIITSIAFNTFVMNKAIDEVWDKYAEELLKVFSPEQQ